jgi:hypothetical protein
MEIERKANVFAAQRSLDQDRARALPGSPRAMRAFREVPAVDREHEPT